MFFGWKIRGGRASYDMLIKLNDASLYEGKKFSQWLREYGLTIYDSIPVIYPGNPYEAYCLFDKTRMQQKGWMTKTKFCYVGIAEDLFDLNNMTESDWRKTIFAWHRDVIERGYVPEPGDLPEKLPFVDRFALTRDWIVRNDNNFGDKQYLFQGRRLQYVENAYDQLPLDGSCNFYLALIVSRHSATAFVGPDNVYAALLVNSNDDILGFAILSYSKKAGSPLKKNENTGFLSSWTFLDL